MQTHERTMLARLGFADPDRREPLHDQACQYLTSRQMTTRLARLLGVEHGPLPWRRDRGDRLRIAMLAQRIVRARANIEVEISKGQDRYRTTIGFADVVLEFDLQVEQTHAQERCRQWHGLQRQCSWSAWQSIKDEAFPHRLAYGIEVKIKPVPLGDLVRQIKLYRSYSGVKRWIAVTAYPLTSSETASLHNEGILHMRLGPAFEQYVGAQRQGSAAAAATEI